MTSPRKPAKATRSSSRRSRGSRRAKEIRSRIWIPTYGRARIRTYANLPESLQARCILVVSPDDGEHIDLVKSLCPKAAIVLCPVQGQGSAIVKQWILERAKDQVVIIADDDLSFQSSDDPDCLPSKFRGATGHQIELGFQAMATKCLEPDIGFCCPCSTYFNNSTGQWLYNRKGVYLFFIDRKKIKSTGVQFDLVPAVGDVAFSMQMAEAGYGSALYNRLACKDSAKNSIDFQTADWDDRYQKAAELMMQRWPKFVVQAGKKKQNINLTVRFANAVKYYQKQKGNK